MRLSSENTWKPIHQMAVRTRMAKTTLASGPDTATTMRFQGEAAKKLPGSGVQEPASVLPWVIGSSPFILQ